MKEQWKLLLEQKSIGYVYPCEVASNDRKQNDIPTAETDDWQIVVPVNDVLDDNGKKELKDSDNVVETDGNENYGESVVFNAIKLGKICCATTLNIV